MIVSEGGIRPLVNSLDSANLLVKEQSASALALLAAAEQIKQVAGGDLPTRIAIAEEGGIAPLIALLDLDMGSTECQVRAAAALSDLAVLPVNKAAIVAAGGIAPLVALLSDGGGAAKTRAAAALARLANDDEVTQVAIGDAGAIAPLVNLLSGDRGEEAQEEAAGALYALADHAKNRNSITESGGIGPLVVLLGCDNARARHHAEGALVRLSIENANRVLIIKQLVSMLHDKGSAAQEQAAAALANLARDSTDNPTSIVDAAASCRCSRCSRASRPRPRRTRSRRSRTWRTSSCQPGGHRQGGRHRASRHRANAANNMKEAAAADLSSLCAAAITQLCKHNPANRPPSSMRAIQSLVSMLGSPNQGLNANAAGALSGAFATPWPTINRRWHGRAPSRPFARWCAKGRPRPRSSLRRRSGRSRRTTRPTRRPSPSWVASSRSSDCS